MNPSIAKPIAPAAIAGRTAAVVSLSQVDNERNNPLRIFSLYLGIAMVFLRVSAFHQAQTVLMGGVNLKLLYVVGIPAVLGTVLCGGLGRAFKRSPTVYWAAFWIWMVAASPTSVWPGDSVRKYDYSYLRTNLVMMIVVAGLIVSWKECRTMMRCLAWSGVGSLMCARLFQSERMSRFTLEFGTVSNSNDFAAHLLFCMPFLYWTALRTKNFGIRLIALAGIGYGVIVIVHTGSRGGLVGIVAVSIALFCWGSTNQRLVLLAAAPITMLAVVSVVPHDTLVRITSFSAEESSVSVEALESSAQRKYLLRKSIEYTFKFPLFGVGPGQFSEYEGRHNQVIGTHGMWHATHNTFTQVSSECGIPAFLFFVAGLVASFRIFHSRFKKSKKIPGCEDIRDAMLCTMLCMVGFTVAIFFLNFAYFFYEPFLGAWAVAVAGATKEEFENRQRAAEAVPVQPAFGPARFPQWAGPAPKPA